MTEDPYDPYFNYTPTQSHLKCLWFHAIVSDHTIFTTSEPAIFQSLVEHFIISLDSWSSSNQQPLNHWVSAKRHSNRWWCNKALNDQSPPISDEEVTLNRSQQTALSQLRSGHCSCWTLRRIGWTTPVDSSCQDCGANPHNVNHLFNWKNPDKTIQWFSYINTQNLE